MNSKNNKKNKKNQEKKIEISTSTIINIVSILIILTVFSSIYISKEMEVKSIEGHKKAAAQAIKTMQAALDKRDDYNTYNKGWGYFSGAEFCNPPLGMDRDMLSYGATPDVNAPKSLASYLICSPDKGVSEPVVSATSGCSNNIFQTKDGMIFSHMNSSSTRWDRVFYVDTNGGGEPTKSIASFRKKTCSLDGGYGDTSSIANKTESVHEKCAPNNSSNAHPDVICLIIRGGNKILPGDERTKKILETGHAIANSKNGKTKK